MQPIHPKPATRPVTTNDLLTALPTVDRHRLLKHCRHYRLHFAKVLCEPGARVRHVYFPNHGLISLLTPVRGRANVEVGMVGREGFVGVSPFLGVSTSPVQWLVQGAGDALRIRANDFTKEITRSRPLRDALNRYVYTFIAQVGQTAACNSHHELGQRLARWLLMTHDRVQTDTFLLTQQFLAQMLNVQRAGVTRAAGILQRRKLIRYRRGAITILDRPGLERAACSCYRAVRDIAERALH